MSGLGTGPRRVAITFSITISRQTSLVQVWLACCVISQAFSVSGGVPQVLARYTIVSHLLGCCSRAGDMWQPPGHCLCLGVKQVAQGYKFLSL